MAMTAAVKDELARVELSKSCCRKAEVSALLRFAGGLHLVSGQIVVEAELDAGQIARRLRKDIVELYDLVPFQRELMLRGAWLSMIKK